LPAGFTHGVPVYVLEVMIPWNDLPRDLELADINHCQPPAQRDPRTGVVEMLPHTARELQRRHEQRVAAVARRGVEVAAVRVQANALLHEPSQYDNLPGLVLVAFDRTVAANGAYLFDPAERLFDLKTTSPRTAAEQQAQAIILANQEQAEYHRRRQLPLGFTGGPVVWACDLWVHRPYLPRGFLVQEERYLNCVAEPGAQGGIEMLPVLEVEAV
jgi:hypothetical protein